MGSDPTVQEHLGDLYQKTGRLKLAAAHWERAVAECEQNRPRGSRQRRPGQSPAETRRRQSPPGEGTIRQAVASDEVTGTDFLSVLAAQYSVLSARARLSKCWPATPYTWNNRVDAASLSLLTLPRRLQRDRDRVIHARASAAWRPNPGLHPPPLRSLRNRLTHTIEVAQISALSPAHWG